MPARISDSAMVITAGKSSAGQLIGAPLSFASRNWTANNTTAAIAMIAAQRRNRSGSERVFIATGEYIAGAVHCATQNLFVATELLDAGSRRGGTGSSDPDEN